MAVSAGSRHLPPWLTAVGRSLGLPAYRHAIVWWTLTRVLLFAVWSAAGFTVQGDLIHYYQSMWYVFHGYSPAAELVEYPTPVIWVLAVPYLLGGGTRTGFIAASIGLLVVIDALIGFTLWRSPDRSAANPHRAVIFWIWFVVAMGPIVYMRLDLLTAGLSAAGLIAVIRSRRYLSGAMIGLGAGLKLWPALLWPATWTDRRSVRRASIGFLATGAVLVAASVLYAGWTRLFSPLVWQADRGLQIESVFATPAMIAHLVDPARWPLFFSAYNAYEVLGPGTNLLIGLTTVATGLGGLIMIVAYAGWLRRPDRTPAEAGMLMVAATLIMMLANRTLSPQYLIWLAGPTAVLLTIPAPPAATRLNPLRLAGWVVALAAVTQLIYPILYDHLILGDPVAPLVVAILAARNLGLAYLGVRVTWSCVRHIGFPKEVPQAARA